MLIETELRGLKYPVLLVHGAGFRDKIFGFISYWGRIPKLLEENGAIIYYGGTDAWGTVEENAKKLKETVRDIVCRHEKVNIIAHSRGGLEARYLINELEMGDYVASLTTVSTPHRGAKIMNIALLIPTVLYKVAAFFVNLWCKIIGDKNPDFYSSSLELSERYCTEFNEKYPNKEGIYYQSYASKLKYFFGDPLFILLNPILKISDGDNDGLCPVESAKWGDFKGVITTKGLFGISHSGVVDAYRITYKGVDIPKIYLQMLKDLSDKNC
jgi:triacylglycerol lipase